MAVTVGEKGQVVIEKPIREALGILRGFVAVQELRGDHVEIRFYPPEHTRSLHGALAAKIKRSVDPRNWEKEREKAWRQAAGESHGAKKAGS